jgi:stress response protein YsnF
MTYKPLQVLPIFGGLGTDTVCHGGYHHDDRRSRERTIGAEGRDEQAVMSKQARVEEELVVHRDVEERTETDSDTVRKEVDIEDGCDVRSTGTGSTDRSR